MDPTDSDRPGFQWLDACTVRTTYDMLLYGFDDCQAEPPLSPGCPVRVGPYRYRVLAEEPETATVLLATDGVAWSQWWQYQRKDKTNYILTKLFWNDPVMRLRFWLKVNPLRRVCSWLGYILLRLAGER